MKNLSLVTKNFVISFLLIANCFPTLLYSFTFVHQQKRKMMNSQVVSSPTLLFAPVTTILRRSDQKLNNNKNKNNICLVTALRSNSNDDYVEAEDLPAIQTLFTKYCDKEGLMTIENLKKVPPFEEMLADGDLLVEELNDIWDAAPKFPDVGGDDTRIDVDSFVQIYRDVDDLFEDEDNVDSSDQQSDISSSSDESSSSSEKEEDEADDDDNDDDSVDAEDETVEAELEKVFETLCDKDRLVSKSTLKEWEEIEKLLAEGLLDDDEFDELWAKTAKSPGSSEQLDVDGFLSFNVALDGLFEFDDDDDEEDIEEDITDTAVDPPSKGQVQSNRQMVEGGDLPPGVLFAAIADEDYRVGMDELKLWVELQEMLEEGDLLPSELQAFYDSIDKTESGKLSEEGFITLYEKIDELFEDDDESSDETQSVSAAAPGRNVVKEDLMSFLQLIDNDIEEENLPCGLDSSEKDQKQVLNIIKALEEQPNNIIRQKNGDIDTSDLSGTWELVYASSNAMKFNKGLSGLGGSFPNGRFGGLKQKLEATKFVKDVEYIERIEVNPSAASFDVSVTGNWDLRTSMSLFTGQPSIVLNIEPDRVNYGPTSTRADHWKSLGPMNMLDLTYLDEDFRVMRGCTSTETVFLFKRSS